MRSIMGGAAPIRAPRQLQSIGVFFLPSCYSISILTHSNGTMHSKVGIFGVNTLSRYDGDRCLAIRFKRKLEPERSCPEGLAH